MDDDQLSDGTDLSVGRSTSLSISDEDEGDTAYSSEHEASTSSRSRRRRRKANTLDMEPEDKLIHFRKVCEKLKKQNKTESLFTELLKLPPLARLSYGDMDWRYAVACAELSEGYIQKQYPVQALKYAERAKTVITQGGCNHDGYSQSYFFVKVSQIYLTLGKAYFLDKKYENCENILTKAWHVCVKKSKSPNVTSVEVDDSEKQNLKRSIKQSLADVYIKLKKPDRALKCLLYLKEVFTSEHGPKSRQLIPIYKNMAKVEKMKPKDERNFDLVVEYCKEVHIIASEKCAESGDEMADSAFNLAQAYLCFDEEFAFKAAETYLNEALELYMQVHDKQHSKVIKTKDVICKLLIRTERGDEALDILRGLLKTKTSLHGEYSSPVAETNKLIGSIYLSRGNLKDAYTNLQKCYDIEEQIHGKTHWKTKSTLNILELVTQSPEVVALQDQRLKNRPHFNTVIKSRK